MAPKRSGGLPLCSHDPLTQCMPIIDKLRATSRAENVVGALSWSRIRACPCGGSSDRHLRTLAHIDCEAGRSSVRQDSRNPDVGSRNGYAIAGAPFGFQKRMIRDVTDLCFSDERSSKASDFKLPGWKSQVDSGMAVKI